MASRIQRGVSLYSFQDETFLGKMTMEDCVATCASFGALGIEVVSEQTFWNYPEQALAEADVARWHKAMEVNGTHPVCHDFMLDYKRYKGRPMPFEEQVASVKRDIDTGKRLGCPFIRSLVSVAPEVLVAAAPYAEEQGVKILLEVHAPLHFDHPWIIRHAEAYERSGSDHLGFLPDMGMFLHRFPRVWKERFVRNGCPQHIADYIETAYEDRILSEYVVLNVREMGGEGVALAMAETLRHNAAFEPRRMLDFMPRIHNIHGKFYEMNEDLVEPSIPYDKIVAALDQGGYAGHICSEYEGNRWIEDVETVDSVEQVRRHQTMLARLIGEPSPAVLAV